jgi:predicted dehydrogenase
MGISIGLVGLGAFGSAFADLFKNHPLVDRVGLCDREPERMEKFASREDWKDKFNRRDMYSSLEEICRSDLDALVIITQHWLHAPQAVKAMEHGKHVYCAVPLLCVPDGDEILEWCDRLIETCKRTGMLFMYGETTYYRPAAMFCRRKAAEGAFGDFVYAEGEYFHDLDSGCSLREVIAHRLRSKAGAEWIAEREKYRKRGIKGGPMHYPTHSTCGPVCVMKAHAVKVTAYGYRNRNNDPYFKETDEEFSNEVALFLMSNGATVRICEFREVAGSIADSETFRIMGTRGTYCENTWKENFRTEPFTAKPLKVTKLTDAEMRDPLPPEVVRAFNKVYGVDSDSDFTPRGHGGSHPYLVHEFVDAVAHGRLPAINAWEAVRYTAMGVMAHKSALRDGETLNVPDWGDPPVDSYKRTVS